jgi:hypothetical protein
MVCGSELAVQRNVEDKVAQHYAVEVYELAGPVDEILLYALQRYPVWIAIGLRVWFICRMRPRSGL